MLSLQALSLTQFRNYEIENFAFNSRVVAICGLNGTGKTNLLDAIYYLCFTRSYFTRPDAQSVKYGLQGLRIQGNFIFNNDAHKAVCILRENNKKEFWLNEEQYTKFSAHLGRFPAVMITPDDVELITGSSEERRRFIDTIICQVQPDYLNNLITYNKILQQRNSFLKALYEHQRQDETLLDTLDEQLAVKGQALYEQRKQFMQEFLPRVKNHYASIAQHNYFIDVNYESQLHNANMQQLLLANRQRDKYLQRTGAGIHKDDLAFMVQEQPFKQAASQGQRKSLLFALKLAEYDTIKAYKGFAPILLLDDVFEKLDAQRMHNLLNHVCCVEDAQVFITDTHKARLQKQLNDLNVSFELIEL